MTFSSKFNFFLIHLWIVFVSCAVHHIVPSPDNHCPVESCLTISSLAADISLYLDSNTSLTFQPGNYTMHSELNITNVSKFSMTLYPTERSHAGIIIYVCENSGFIFESASLVYMSNLKFFGCKYKSTNKSDSVLITITESNLILLECSFEDNSYIRGLISAKQSDITIPKVFLGTTVSSGYITLYFSLVAVML